MTGGTVGRGVDSVRPHRRYRHRQLALLAAVVLLSATLIRTFVLQPFYIPTESMENTLRVGDRVLVEKLSYRIHGVRRGDIVVFDGLDSFGTETRTDSARGSVASVWRYVAASLGLAPPGGHDVIKRVIGVAGDNVTCCDRRDRVRVNGIPLDESSYLFPGDSPTDGPRFDVTVPPGRLWVMGDHRSASADSRSHLGRPGGGTVPQAEVIGRAMAVVWPPARLTALGTPSGFAAVDKAGRDRSLAPAYSLRLEVGLPCATLWTQCQRRRDWTR